MGSRHRRQVLLAALALSCVKAPPSDPPSDEVQFGDRTIALAPYLGGYPYAQLVPLFDAGVLLYDREGAQRQLTRVPLDDVPDLASGAPVGSVDWNTRTRWSMVHHRPSGAVYFTGDARNDERLNVYRMSLHDGAPVAITDEPYVYGWSFDPREERLAVIVRRGEGPYTSCLETMAPDGTDRQPIVCDTPAAPFTWGAPSWAPDGRGVIVPVTRDSRRDRRNLAWIPFDRPELQLLLDPVAVRTRASALDLWLDEARVVVVDDSTGLPRIGVLDVTRGDVAWRLALDRDLSDLRLIRGERVTLLGVLHRPDGDRLVTWDPETGDVLDEHPIDGTVEVLGDDERGRALVSWTSARSPFATAWVDLSADGTLTVSPWIGLPAEVARRIVQCEVEAVTFPTHDIDPSTGALRQLHGFLYTPREPLRDPAVRITAFYGGSNRFDVETQVFCEAGIATFSPAVRGSWGYGSEFQRLNDGDLGGNEIADLFHAARFLEARGYPASRIGVYGRSHGGYATMRALTFPPGTNGHDTVFPFAFGLADAGFSDIVSFHDACNIPDWVLLEAGDPVTERDKLRDRSPLHHVARLSGPLLLVHGENDSRVPVAESRQMAEACAAAGKECTYVEIPGQGHRVRGLEHEQRVWQARMDFMERVLLGG